MENLNNYIPTLHEAKKYIDNFNFNRIINKMVLVDGWIINDAIDTCEMYRNFIFLKKKFPNVVNIVPSKDIDEFWHCHILATQDYKIFSDNIFGKNHFLHHYPFFGIDGKSNMNDVTDAFSVTQELYYKEFLTKINPTRSKFPKLVYYFLKKMSNFHSEKEEKSNINDNLNVADV